MKRTEKPTVRLGDAQRAAKTLCTRYDVDMDKEELGGKLYEVANYIVQEKELSYEQLKKRAVKIASEMVENAIVSDSSMYEEYKGLRDYVRGADISFHQLCVIACNLLKNMVI